MKNVTYLESNLEGILVPDQVQAILSVVSIVKANMPSGIKPTNLSKLCIISETLSEGAFERNMQLKRNKYDFFLSSPFMINKRMLRYRIFQRIFFSYTMFVTPK